MARDILAEKFQVSAPNPPKESDSWASDSSVRVKHAQTRLEIPSVNLNPPGTGSFPLRDAGVGDVSDTSDKASQKKGFKRLDMTPYDDQYSGEHVDQFYGEAEGADGCGFVERNNYLDRN